MPAGIAALVTLPSCGWGRAALRPRLEHFISRLKSLPNPRPCIAERFRAIGLAAMGRVGQRWPSERDKGAPGEIVKGWKRVGFGRWDIVDAVGERIRLDVFRRGWGRRKKEPDRRKAKYGGEVVATCHSALSLIRDASFHDQLADRQRWIFNELP
jgi:hypothetical protein